MSYKRKLGFSLNMSLYVFCLNHFKLNDKGILLQSRYGDDLGGNIFYMMKYLSENYPTYSIYLAYTPKNKKKYVDLLNFYHVRNIQLVELHKRKYWYLLATCKYLINDVTFHEAFIKREGQVYLNTWHGVPLKKMGLDEEQDAYLFGNMQKNFIDADYLLCPNQYMTDIMIHAYSLNNLFKGKILNEGYPRNSVLLDDFRRNEVRQNLGISDKQVIVYMPTWRGSTSANKSESYVEELEEYLSNIEENLDDNQYFYVKLHPLVSSQLDFSKYRKILPFPKGYETYDFLSAADCLVTDYSSVMFDYACTGRKIILFTYDKEEYLKDRGLYFDINKLPFTQVSTPDELMEVLKNGCDYAKDTFIRDLTCHDNIDSAKHLCDMLLHEKNVCHEVSVLDNHKDKVFLYADQLLKNGITSALFNLLNCIDLNKRNYFIVFKEKGVKENKNRLKLFPEGVGILSLKDMDRTLLELVAFHLYYKKNKNWKCVHHYLDRCYHRMFHKYYGNFHNADFVQFVGYGQDPLHLFLQANRKYVFVHNDMKKEIQEKGNQHLNTIIESYSNYDLVAGVSRKSTDIAAEIGHNRTKYRVVHNCFDYRGCLEKSKEHIHFDNDTRCLTMNVHGIEGVLSANGPKIITVGRFSEEKEHERLIEAFNLYWDIHKDAQLIIIGGYGKEYEKTIKFASNMPCASNITIIRSISNPYPIMRRCDLFVLSSSHEGLPVVFFEADCLGLPILSTDIEGPHDFLQKYHGGLLVEESAEALYKGMLQFDKGNIKLLNIDMTKYNNQCVEEFENLFDFK